MRHSTLSLLCFATVCACKCGPSVAAVQPELGLPPGLDFGKVKVSETGTRPLLLTARTNAPIALSSVTFEGADASAFSAGTVTEVPALGSASLPIRFVPTGVKLHLATLVVLSNDASKPTQRIPVVGEGIEAKIQVAVECRNAAPDLCVGSATDRPQGIDFGLTPARRVSPLPVTRLPLVVVSNVGDVPLDVRSVRLEGSDPAAFALEQLPSLGSGRTLTPGEGFNFRVRYTPSASPSSEATVVVASDDPSQAEVRISLRGQRAPNLAPVICANVTRAVPASGEPPREYAAAADWAPLLLAPPSGYDFTRSRDVRPGDLVVLSALSSAEVTSCTSDPEDGRTGLSFAWRLVSSPPESPQVVVQNAATSEARLRVPVTGAYEVELTVTDQQQATASVRLTFNAVVRQDLVVQLEWAGTANVDLDLHLVRPSAIADAGDSFSGAFSFFEGSGVRRTSGDLNGYASRTAATNMGFDFDWGDAGTDDDPRLNVDDTGAGDLVENISLNFPENDARCAAASCRYKVFVHYFKDGRPLPSESCVIDANCVDGEACSCLSGKRCVSTNDDGGVGLGPGRCFTQPKPVVRFFFRGSPTPSASVPLLSDAVVLGAPCQLLYVADIVWPALTTRLPDGGLPPPSVEPQLGDGGQPALLRFGRRSVGQDLQCNTNEARGGVQWYARP